MKYYLCLYIGGTNPRMAMLTDDYRISSEIFTVDKDGTDIIRYINDFLEKAAREGMTTDTCCLSIGGPVIEHSLGYPTNSRYIIDAEKIRRETLLDKIIILNDWEAIAYSLDVLRPGSLMIIKPGHIQHGNKAAFGPGTGLGGAFLLKSQDKSMVMASETGHTGMPTRREFEGLYEFIRQKLGVDQLGLESIISGQGLRHIADYFLNDLSRVSQFYPIYPGLEDLSQAVSALQDMLNRDNDAGVDFGSYLSESAQSNKIARLTMHIFMDCVAMGAQHFALIGLAKGGVFIGGGIIPKNIRYIDKDRFRQIFTDNWKPNIKAYLEDIPVFLITDYDVSFYGCAARLNLE